MIRSRGMPFHSRVVALCIKARTASVMSLSETSTRRLRGTLAPPSRGDAAR